MLDQLRFNGALHDTRTVRRLILRSLVDLLPLEAACILLSMLVPSEFGTYTCIHRSLIPEIGSYGPHSMKHNATVPYIDKPNSPAQAGTGSGSMPRRPARPVHLSGTAAR